GLRDLGAGRGCQAHRCSPPSDSSPASESGGESGAADASGSPSPSPSASNDEKKRSASASASVRSATGSGSSADASAGSSAAASSPCSPAGIAQTRSPDPPVAP